MSSGNNLGGPTEAAKVLRAFFHWSCVGLWLRSHLKSTRSLNEPVTPFSCERRGCCAKPCKIISLCFAVTFVYIVVFTLLKVPYMGMEYMTNLTYNKTECADPSENVACYGAEGQAHLRSWVGFRGLQVSPTTRHWQDRATIRACYCLLLDLPSTCRCP